MPLDALVVEMGFRGTSSHAGATQVHCTPSYGKHHIKDVWKNLKHPPNVLKCNKIVHPAQLTCVVVISCVSKVFGGNLAVIWGAAWKIDFTLKDIKSIEFQSDDITKMIFLKLWVLFNCSEQPIWKKFTCKILAL